MVKCKSYDTSECNQCVTICFKNRGQVKERKLVRRFVNAALQGRSEPELGIKCFRDNMAQVIFKGSMDWTD